MPFVKKTRVSYDFFFFIYLLFAKIIKSGQKPSIPVLQLWLVWSALCVHTGMHIHIHTRFCTQAQEWPMQTVLVFGFNLNRQHRASLKFLGLLRTLQKAKGLCLCVRVRPLPWQYRHPSAPGSAALSIPLQCDWLPPPSVPVSQPWQCGCTSSWIPCSQSSP